MSKAVGEFKIPNLEIQTCLLLFLILKLSLKMSKTIEVQFQNYYKELIQQITTNTQPLASDIADEIERELKKHFFYPDDSRKLLKKSRVSLLGTVKYQFSLTYKGKTIPLSRYPVKQVRVTVGNRKLRVYRLSGKTFKSKIVPQNFEVKTLVRIRKNSGFKLVHGKQGFKGWLHTGNKFGYDRRRAHLDLSGSYSGTINKFSAKVFERNQRPTWRGGVRLPVHQLFGPSLVQLLETAEMTQFFGSSVLFNKINDKLKISFERII